MHIAPCSRLGVQKPHLLSPDRKDPFLVLFPLLRYVRVCSGGIEKEAEEIEEYREKGEKLKSRR